MLLELELLNLKVLWANGAGVMANAVTCSGRATGRSNYHSDYCEHCYSASAKLLLPLVYYYHNY